MFWLYFPEEDTDYCKRAIMLSNDTATLARAVIAFLNREIYDFTEKDLLDILPRIADQEIITINDLEKLKEKMDV